MQKVTCPSCQGKTPSRNNTKKLNYTFIVYQDKRLMFTDDEINKAWLRANRLSGLGIS